MGEELDANHAPRECSAAESSSIGRWVPTSCCMARKDHRANVGEAHKLVAPRDFCRHVEQRATALFSTETRNEHPTTKMDASAGKECMIVDGIEKFVPYKRGCVRERGGGGGGGNQRMPGRSPNHTHPQTLSSCTPSPKLLHPACSSTAHCAEWSWVLVGWGECAGGSEEDRTNGVQTKRSSDESEPWLAGNNCTGRRTRAISCEHCAAEYQPTHNSKTAATPTFANSTRSSSTTSRATTT
jgi:hypothetical protein